jgi:hypothetical protein
MVASEREEKLHADRELGAELMALLDDDAFVKIWGTMMERYVTFDEFKTFEMPPALGNDPERTWQLFYKLRLISGRRVPYPAPHLWYLLPRHEQRRVWDLLSRTDAISEISVFTRSRPLSGIDIQGQVMELMFCLDADGHPMDYEDVRAIITAQRLPHSKEEMVVANYCAFLERQRSQMASNSGVVPTAYDVLNALCDGTVEKTERTPHAVPELSHPRGKEMMQALSESLKLSGSIDASEVVTLSAHLQDVPPSMHILPEWNMTFGSLLRKTFFIRCNRETLSFLPLSKGMFENPRPFPGVLDDYHTMPELWDLSGEYFDLTGYFVSYLSRATSYLDDLERRCARAEDEERRLRERVRGSHRINHRQRDVLLRALDDGSFETTYDKHCREYLVAYSTARSDLGMLENMGMLRRITLANKNVDFKAGADLRIKIESLLSDDRD